MDKLRTAVTLRRSWILLGRPLHSGVHACK